MTDHVYGVLSQSGSAGRRALVLSANKFEDMELYVPVFRLIEAGWRVDIAAPTPGKITGESSWYYVLADTAIDAVHAEDYAFLLIPGGSPAGAPATIRENPHARDIARAFFHSGKPVGAICHGPWLLADADLVRGRKLTSYWNDGVPQSITKAGGIWVDAPVVRDGNLVTSRWPMDLAEFNREMMALLAS